MNWITSFLFLSAVLWFFERKRMDLDWFSILTVALVPALIGLLKTFASMLVELPAWIDVVNYLATYAIVFLLLWKLLGLPKGRSAAYAGGLFVFDVALILLAVSIAGNG